MKKIILILLAVVIGVSTLAQDVGTVTQSKAVQGPVVKTTFAWTSGTNNNSVSATGTSYVRGELLGVTFVPSATVAPTGAYTATLTDEAGIDLLAGRGAGLSSFAASSIVPKLQYMVGPGTNDFATFTINGLLTIAVTNCGNSKAGRIVVYTR